MLTRRLAVKLLAPTVLVSLVLVGACIFGLLYLNHLHVNVANDLSENVQSSKVAGRLETTAENLVGLFRGPQTNPEFFANQVKIQNQAAEALLQQADGLANLENEKILVGKIRAGLEEYLARWQTRNRQRMARSGEMASDADLAKFLEDRVVVLCRDLRFYNADQVEQSDRENSIIVQKLQWGLLAVSLGGAVGGLILGYGVARSLHYSISQLSVRIRDAAGRLSRDLGSVTLEEEGDLGGMHRQMQGIIEEIERVVAQLQQREREVLRAEQLAAVGQVAAGVAHELRNPLTSIKMLVQTGLEGDATNGLPAEDLAIIESEIRRMEQCIRLFLDFARPPDSERRQTNLIEVIHRAIALLEGRARRQKVNVIAKLGGDKLPITIDAEQVHQVLVNLLLNALDALPHGGTVNISVDHDQSAIKNGNVLNRFISIRVADTGPGIAPRIRERLFEPFVTNKETGLGLGLSICKRLIEAHGGTITGQNARRVGAIFSFTLPVEDQGISDVQPSTISN